MLPLIFGKFVLMETTIILITIILSVQLETVLKPNSGFFCVTLRTIQIVKPSPSNVLQWNISSPKPMHSHLTGYLANHHRHITQLCQPRRTKSVLHSEVAWISHNHAHLVPIRQSRLFHPCLVHSEVCPCRDPPPRRHRSVYSSF